MKRKELKLGLYGFGCVGQGLYEVLQRTPGLKTNIKKICVRDKNKSRSLPMTHFTFDPEEIINDPEINTIVELIDDAEAAFQITTTALRKGKAVVTANKKMIACHLEELLALQRRHQVPLLYEAACCAGIPVIRNLEEYFETDLLESVEGIVNGSTNYILTATERHKLSYSAALHQAQQLGYAESDPRLDTQGLDARYKLVLLIAHAFGVLTTPERIFCAGIELLGETELNYAAEKGYKIKLIVHASRSATGEIIAFVMPKFIRSDERFYLVDEVFNGIQTRSCFSDTQFFMGKGAGAYPTASAVLSDLSALTYDYRYEYKKLNDRDELACDAEILLKIFLRCPPRAIQHIVAAFISIEETWRNHTAGYITGILTLRDLRGLVERYPEGISPVLISLPGHQSDHVQDELIEQTAEVMV